MKASNARASAAFGYQVSLSGDTLAVGAYGEASSQSTITNGTTASTDSSAPGAGATYIYRRNGNNWQQEAYLKAANAGASDSFGISVSLSGNTLAIGASREDESSSFIISGTTAPNDNLAADSGAVYIYRRSGSTWYPEAYVKASNPGSEDYFGISVSLSGDTLAVGAYKEDENGTAIISGPTTLNTNGASQSGAVYIYRNLSRLFDPDVRIIGRTQHSITFAWEPNLGPAGTQVIVAPASDESSSPDACQLGDVGGSLTLTATSTSYNYTDLDEGQRYGFRFCSTNGTDISDGSTIWFTTREDD